MPNPEPPYEALISLAIVLASFLGILAIAGLMSLVDKFFEWFSKEK